jgi:AcrR family transcriptional regulator
VSVVTQLRRDAARNRAALISAGRDVFAERGPDAPLEEIARRAGVGIGTLYRHFPTRDALVEVIFAEHFDDVVAAAEAAAADDDAWRGLARFLERLLDLQSQNLPLRSVFLRLPASPAIVERRKLIRPLLERLVERARTQGAVRADLTVGDLLMAMWSFAPLLEATAEVAPQVWRRHLQILLDGMRPGAATPQTVRPLAGRRLELAVEALRERYHRRRAA